MNTDATPEAAAEAFVAETTASPPEERQLSVRLPGHLADALEEAADERDVSKSRLVARAVEKYLLELPPLASVLP